MPPRQEVVITGVNFGGEIDGFEPKQFVRPRKSLKVMSWDIQIGFAAADMAFSDAQLGPEAVQPERIGVVFGADMIYCDLSELTDAYQACIVDGEFQYDLWGKKALGEMQPLWMLKYLPNMTACHIGIARDARGPTNSITYGAVSSLLAVSEAMRVIERDRADVVIAGGSSSRIHPSIWAFRNDRLLSHRNEDPSAACRPFDADRDGMVAGEGAAAFVLESRRHAEARGANILATILGYASTFQPPAGATAAGDAIRGSIDQTLNAAGLSPGDVGHVNANGLSTVEHDKIEAKAIRDTLGEVPVTAPKSFFGNLGAATGAVELAASILALEHGRVPVTLNYRQPDPECPVKVVHGEPLECSKKTAVSLNQDQPGQAVAIALAAP